MIFSAPAYCLWCCNFPANRAPTFPARRSFLAVRRSREQALHALTNVPTVPIGGFWRLSFSLREDYMEEGEDTRVGKV